jgi:hypothetical protein
MRSEYDLPDRAKKRFCSIYLNNIVPCCLNLFSGLYPEFTEKDYPAVRALLAQESGCRAPKAGNLLFSHSFRRRAEEVSERVFTSAKTRIPLFKATISSSPPPAL